MAKDAVFTMKLEPELREAFLEAAREAHRPASQIVRDLMRSYVERQQEAKDYDAFVARKVAISDAQIREGKVVSHEEASRIFARLRAEAEGA
jgi:predicted transcriptional regulator